MLGILKIVLLVVAGAYLAIALLMYFGQRKLIYVPDPTQTRPSEVGLNNVEERKIQTPDGETLVAWYGKARPDQPTLLYFHGNGGALEDRSERMAGYIERGRGVFMMSYRGYSGSTGQPSELANVEDAKRAFDMLVAEGIRPEDIIVYGESIGSGVATQVAADRNPAGLILDSPFTSLAARAAELYPWLPVRHLISDRYDNVRHIKSVSAPLLIIHGEDDTVVPVEMSRQLYAEANQPKAIKTFPGAGHANHAEFGSFRAVNTWIDQLRSGAAD